jgi:hypothetical protein
VPVDRGVVRDGIIMMYVEYAAIAGLTEAGIRAVYARGPSSALRSGGPTAGTATFETTERARSQSPLYGPPRTEIAPTSRAQRRL